MKPSVRVSLRLVGEKTEGRKERNLSHLLYYSLFRGCLLTAAPFSFFRFLGTQKEHQRVFEFGGFLLRFTCMEMNRRRYVPVVNSWGVLLSWLVEVIRTHPLGGEVATWVEHAPPNVVLTSRRGSGGSHRRRRSSRARRHRHGPLVLAAFSFIYQKPITKTN